MTQNVLERRGAPSASELVDRQRGIVSREVFVNEELFERELTYLFGRAWLFLGHVSQVPEVGDYFVTRTGQDSVILTRDDQGEVHGLLNTCRHRGMKVCRYDEGNTLKFTCPYHGWSYTTDGSIASTPGSLFGVPRYATSYGAQLDKESWGLIRMPRISIYKGLVFGSWDEKAPTFEEYVGGFSHWLDSLVEAVDGSNGQSEVLRGVQKWRVPTNWKFVAENFLGDMYHASSSHSSVERVGIGPGGRTADRHGGPKHGFGRVETSFVDLGHGSCSNLEPNERYPEFEDERLDHYFREAWARKEAIKREQGKPLRTGGASTLFPNMSFHAGIFPRSILVAHPVSPWETELWRWYLVDVDAPDFVRDWLRHYYLRYSGPGGLTEQDDIENWVYATEASRGPIARRYPYNYSQGIGMTRPGPIPGTVESLDPMTEENARNFYHRWAEFVDGLSWDVLIGADG